ncbi:MAG: sigma-E processing peptidase SpoIIGA [Oscillospiraceae bacterium]|nr:sigma-E processing peptidase SpoIIGA [Oscillospiraceae bacterium]
MIVYIDSLVLLNGIINYLLLLAAAKIDGRAFRRRRLLLGALFGALYAAAVWVPGWQGVLGSIWGKLISAVLITVIAFAPARLGRLLRLSVIFTSAAFLLGGVVLALGLLTGAPSPAGGMPYLPVDFKALFLTAGLSYGLLTLVFKYAGRHGASEMAEIIVSLSGREVKTKGLIDTGHSLTDPVSGSEVLILELEMSRQLLPQRASVLLDEGLLAEPSVILEMMGSLGLGTLFRLIPYRVLGTECAFLLAFRPDKVMVCGRERKYCLIGISPGELSAGAGIRALVSAK